MADAGSVHPVPVVAGALSALLAGTGQLYAGQRKRGIAYLATEAAFVLALFTVLRGPLRGLITLMPTGRFVDSRHILIVGIWPASSCWHMHASTWQTSQTLYAPLLGCRPSDVLVRSFNPHPPSGDRQES